MSKNGHVHICFSKRSIKKHHIYPFIEWIFPEKSSARSKSITEKLLFPFPSTGPSQYLVKKYEKGPQRQCRDSDYYLTCDTTHIDKKLKSMSRSITYSSVVPFSETSKVKTCDPSFMKNMQICYHRIASKNRNNQDHAHCIRLKSFRT
jgi:hypothetical protein